MRWTDTSIISRRRAVVSWENVREFAEFCRDSGGFDICSGGE
jgi:hypothetical protein